MENSKAPTWSDVFNGIITQSRLMHHIFEMVEKVAATRTNVLIIGESGTGKELIAQAIHQLSRNRPGTFVAVDCGAIPESLIESELFGHEKGAFTGAHIRKAGKFELSHEGTLFLDEIANIPYDLQAKLLRVLQDRVIVPIGGHRRIQADVRVVAACNVNLSKAVEEGKFRSDLYFRLNVVPIHLPPLRERKEDISVLANHFLQKFNLQLHKKMGGFSEQVFQAMMTYHWPGNIREMENLIERMVVLGREEGLLTLKDLPLDLVLSPHNGSRHGSASNPGLKELCKSFERRVILKTLEEMEWNRSKTARALKIHRNTLNLKLQNFDSK